MIFNFKKVATFLKLINYNFTYMEIPHFIFDLFEKELINIQQDLLKKVATKYSLNYDELIKDFLPKEVKLTPNTNTSIQIKKKQVQSEPPEATKRCMARIWNRGKGGQCIRGRSSETGEYCSQHEKNRKHGRIDEPPNINIFPKDSKAIYK